MEMSTTFKKIIARFMVEGFKFNICRYNDKSPYYLISEAMAKISPDSEACVCIWSIDDAKGAGRPIKMSVEGSLPFSIYWRNIDGVVNIIKEYSNDAIN